jgi:hypothetical protein
MIRHPEDRLLTRAVPKLALVPVAAHRTATIRERPHRIDIRRNREEEGRDVRHGSANRKSRPGRQECLRHRLAGSKRCQRDYT